MDKCQKSDKIVIKKKNGTFREKRKQNRFGIVLLGVTVNWSLKSVLREFKT